MKKDYASRDCSTADSKFYYEVCNKKLSASPACDSKLSFGFQNTHMHMLILGRCWFVSKPSSPTLTSPVLFLIGGGVAGACTDWFIVRCHARSLLLRDQQFDIHSYWEEWLGVGPYLPQLPQSTKAMRQRAHDCI